MAWLTVRSDRSVRLVMAEVGKGERVMVSKMEPCGVTRHRSVVRGRGGRAGGGSAGGRQCGSGPGGGTGTTSSEWVDASVEGNWLNEPLHPCEEGSTTGASWEEISGECCCIWPDPTHRAWPYPSHSMLKSSGSESGQQSQSIAWSRWSGVML